MFSHHLVQMLCSPDAAHRPLTVEPQSVISDTVCVMTSSWAAFPEYKDTQKLNHCLNKYVCNSMPDNPTWSLARTEDFFELDEYEREQDTLQKRLDLEKKVSVVPLVPHISHITAET